MRRFCRRIAFYGSAMTFQYRAVLSPCIGVCMLDDRGFCDGCLRSREEIAGWLAMDDAQREDLMERVLPAREAQRGR